MADNSHRAITLEILNHLQQNGIPVDRIQPSSGNYKDQLAMRLKPSDGNMIAFSDRFHMAKMLAKTVCL